MDVVPDTNVLLHARALAGLPWGELGLDAVRVVLVGPTLREIDKHKNGTGRLVRRARELSAMVREVLILPGRSRIIHEADPSVTLEIAPGLDVDRALHASLDVTHPDHALVNHCLALARSGREVVLLTDDTLASLVAEAAGVRAILLPSAWLLEPGADETERKLKRAQAEIEELRRAEPQMSIAIRDLGDRPIERVDAVVRRYPPLSDSQVRTLVDEARCLCPPTNDFGPTTVEEALEEERARRTILGALAGTTAGLGGLVKSVFQAATDEEIARYRNETYPAWIRRLSDELGRLATRMQPTMAWPEFELVLANAGSRPASGVVMAIRARGSLTVARFLPPPTDAPGFASSLPSPPAAPRGGILRRQAFEGLLGGSRAVASMIERGGSPLTINGLPDFSPPDPGEFRWRQKRGVQAEKLEAACHSWRHQEAARRSRIVIQTGVEAGEVRGAIEVRLAADNAGKPMIATLPVVISVNVGDTLGLARALVSELPRRDPGDDARKRSGLRAAQRSRPHGGG